MGEHMCAIITLKGYWHVAALASYPAFTDGQKKRLVSAVCTCMKFSQKSGKPCYFGILPHMEYA